MVVTRRGLAAQTGAAHPLSGRQITSKNFVTLYKVVHGPLDAESMMLQSSSPSQQGSSSSCRDPAYEVWKNWREGRVGLLSHREIANAEKTLPCLFPWLQPTSNLGQGGRMPQKMTREGVYLPSLQVPGSCGSYGKEAKGQGSLVSLQSGDTGCWAPSGREQEAGGSPSTLIEKIPNQETKEPYRVLRGASQPAQLIPQMQRPLGRLCRENKMVLDPSKTVSGGAHIFLHAHRVWVSRRVSDPLLPTGARKGSNPEEISITHRALDWGLSHCSPSPSVAAATCQTRAGSHSCLVGRAVGASAADRDIIKGACTGHTVSAICTLSVFSHSNGREGFFSLHSAFLQFLLFVSFGPASSF